ncbi:MAG: LysE family translocator [Granulosicoccaceae bacterium]
MSEIQQFLPGVLLSLSAVMLALMSPGPNIMAVIGTSMGVGRKQGIALALGVGSGTFLWVSLAVLGFTAVISKYAIVMMTLKVLGGLYLLWLGYKALRSAASSKEVNTTVVSLESRTAYFRRGLTVQMTNPKAAMATLAIVSIGVHAGAPMWVGSSIVFGATFLSMCGHIMYALAFSTRPMVVLYSRARRYIEAALGTFFVRWVLSY